MELSIIFVSRRTIECSDSYGIVVYPYIVEYVPGRVFEIDPCIAIIVDNSSIEDILLGRQVSEKPDSVVVGLEVVHRIPA